ncbi:hypothetical protein [Bacillus infantis]|uniref:Uncharacterized protein n=1 Tax=Bacillus infantis TaxID=324767 RepID=A0A5D4R6W5_9BACI|nr:hypothetical protein [Bacillus infantis]TYS45706.1 hypothetical protein FZD51_19250 [Bacillus infantis]
MLTLPQTEDAILVCIPNEEVLQRIQSHLSDSHSCCLASSDPQVIRILKSGGHQRVIEFGPKDEYLILRGRFRKVIVFESEIAETCTLLKVIRNSTCAPIIVAATVHGYPMRLYCAYGAKYVVYSKSNNISCLLS